MKSSVTAITLFILLLPGLVAAREPSELRSPAEVLQRLRSGNAAFVAGQGQRPRSDASRAADTAKNGQHPIAVVIGCADSRVPPEIVFDQGIGDLFVVRVAGNVCGPHEAGSTEYAVDKLGVRVIVVLGHSHCGAVGAAVSSKKIEGNLGSIVDVIRPVVDAERRDHPDLQAEQLLSASITANARHSAGILLKISKPIRTLVEDGKVKIVPAVYDLSTGKVEWLDDEKSNVNHPQ